MKLLRFALAWLGAVTITSAEWTPWNVADQAAPPSAATLWFRAWLRVPDNMAGDPGTDLWRDSMTMTLQDLPGKLAVSINGRSILETKDVPASEPRRFKVPRGSFENGVFNAIVIRLEGASVKVAPFINGYFDEVKLTRWEWSAKAPSESDLKPAKEPPKFAAFTESDFHPATTVMRASKEPVRGKFVPPEEALRLLKTDDDLLVEELLHEPLVAQPTHVSFDERGRMWIAQYRQYPYPAGVNMISRDKFYRSKYDRAPPPPPRHDRGADVISVHEDRDGDGAYETHREVLTGLNMANAALRGYGGIWVMHTPYLLFYPDADGDDAPDRDPEVRLQGFGLEDTHSTANGLAWGPDGWLYGAQGSTTTSRVTRPGVDPPDAPGVYVEGCMVWRYHPGHRAYEIFADGSGNTFGVSFDEEGRLFTGHNGGETRGWHHVQEGVYLKQGKDPGKFGPVANPFAFGEMPMMRSANPIPRFTHMTILASGTALPDRLRGQFLGADPLHHYLVAAQRTWTGSTFETRDVGYPLRTDDLTFRPVYLTNAPDGSVVIADFREEFIAHGQNYQSQIDPFTGRIYRLRGKNKPLAKDIDLSRKTSAALVGLLRHPNQWHRFTAVRLLGERRDSSVEPALRELLRSPDAHPALEALWALHQMGKRDETLTMACLEHPAAPVRAWAARLAGDERQASDALAVKLSSLAAKEPNAETRCQLLSTARRLPAKQALPIVRAVALRSDDVRDAFIPLMAWFTLESHCTKDRDQALALFDEPEFWSSPLVREHLTPRIMRRFAASGARQELLACASLLARAPSEADRAALLRGFEEAFAGRPLPPLPRELVEALAKTGKLTLTLRVRRGEPEALAEALGKLGDPSFDPARRLELIRVFGEAPHPPAVERLLAVASSDSSPAHRAAACAALQAYDDEAIGETIAGAWPSLPTEARAPALSLLSSRAIWGRRLLEKVAEGRIPRAAITVDVLDRLKGRQDAKLTEALAKFGDEKAKPGGEALRKRMEEVRQVIAKAPGDPYRGEAHFNSLCASCHTLFFKGGKIGPDLTSYQRDDLGTMLVSVIDPNAEIREGFENQIVTTKDGRTVSGFLADEDANVITLRGFDGQDLSLRREEISGITPLGRSLMPQSLLDGLKDSEIQDLFAYLRQSQPITR